jgi:tetratricopeptide (TPR) repeat protein
LPIRAHAPLFLSVAHLYLVLQNSTQAEHNAEEALKLAAQHNDSMLYSQISATLSCLLVSRHEFARAKALLTQSIAFDRERNDLRAEAEKNELLCQVLLRERDSSRLIQARTLCEDLLTRIAATPQSTEREEARALTFHAQAHCALSVEQFTEALREFGKAREIYDSLQLPLQRAAIDTQIALTYRAFAATGHPHLLAEADWHHRAAQETLPMLSEKAGAGDDQAIRIIPGPIIKDVQ